MSRTVQLVLAGILVVVWGSTWLAIQIGLSDIPPFLGAGLRFLAASVILFGLGRLLRVPWPRARRVHLGLGILGLLTFGINYGSLYWGQQYIPSGLAAVLFATFPLFVMGLAYVALPTESIGGGKIVGALLGLVGVVTIFLSDLSISHPRAFLGAAVATVSPFCAACGSVGIKKWGHRLHPFNLTTLPMAYGGLFLLTVSLLTEDLSSVRFTGAAVGSIAYLVLFGSVVGFLAYFTLLRHVAVSLLAFITFTFPVVAVLLGWIFVGEVLSTQTLAGSALVVLGIAMASLRRSGAPERPLPAEKSPSVGPDRSVPPNAGRDLRSVTAAARTEAPLSRCASSA